MITQMTLRLMYRSDRLYARWRGSPFLIRLLQREERRLERRRPRHRGLTNPGR
jgi:hypothetical protein